MKSLIFACLCYAALQLAPLTAHGQHLDPHMFRPVRFGLLVESKTALSFEGTAEEIFLTELRVRVGPHVSLGTFALTDIGAGGVHLGGGVVVHYDLDWLELLTRMTMDHHFSDSPENVVRAEFRATWWIFHHFGLAARVITEHFPRGMNVENAGHWNAIAGLGVAARLNHFLSLAALVNLHVPDMTAIDDLDTSEPNGSVILLAEVLLPFMR